MLEKSRGVGGRVATRRVEGGAAFDHGAQYFTVRDAVFGVQVKQWCAAGLANLWKGRIVSLNKGVVTDLREPQDRYVGVPAMNAIAKTLSAGLNVHTDVTAQSVRRRDGKWQLRMWGARCMVPTTWSFPPHRRSRRITLLSHLSATIGHSANTVTMAPCWAVMLQTAVPLQLSFDAAFVHDSPLSWIAKNSSKPERGATDCWVLHASATWSRDHLEESADTIAKTLIEQFWQATQQAPQPPEFMAAHRWRYALPQESLPQRYLLDWDAKLGACGDWCGGPRVEGAFLSGIAMAQAVLEAA